MSTKKEMNDSSIFEEARAWYASNYAEALQLDSGLIPDLRGKKAEERKTLDIPLNVTRTSVEALAKRFSCTETTLLETALGMVLSAWNAESRACFAAEHSAGAVPVLVTWQPGKPLEELMREVEERTSGAESHACYTFDDCVKELEISKGVLFKYPSETAPAGSGENPAGESVSFGLLVSPEGKFTLHCSYRSDLYSETLLKNFAESLAACILSMETAATAGDV